MGAFLVFMIKSTLSLAAFYLFYRLLLNGNTFHRLNRVILLGIVILSTVIPLIHFSTNASVVLQQPLRNIEYLLLMATSHNVAEADISQLLLFIAIIFTIYLCGCLFFLFRFIYSLRQILGLISLGEKHYIRNGIYLVVVCQDIAPFSWMKYIVISKVDLEDNGKAIWLHEKAHIDAGHSVDMLFMSLFSIIHWFNPAVWLLKEDLQNVHEYEADEQVINHGVNIKQYQLLLIKKAVGSQRFTSMANSFNHSKLKSRITMMLKSKSNSYARLKCLYVLPLSALAVVAFARPEISQQFEKISSVKVIQSSAVVQANAVEKVQMQSKALSDVVSADSLPAGKSKAATIHISSAASEDKGKPLFYLDGVEITESRASSLDASIIESVSVLKDKAALEKYGEKGKNGVILISTKKQEKASLSGVTLYSKEAIKICPKTSNPGVTLDSKETPVYIVDGKEISQSEMEAIATDKIESVNVLKGEHSKAVYGNKYEGRSVVVIKLKDN
ncbi:MAG: M56 family metallopeptidase [Parabacteroides sp.]